MHQGASEVITEAVPEQQSKRLNPNAVVIEQKVVTPNSYRIPFDVPICVSQQEEENGISFPNVNHSPTGSAPSFISQEVNSADDSITAMPPATMANRVTFNVPTMFSRERVNQVTAGIYYGEGEDKWMPRTFITASSGNSHGGNEYDVDVEHSSILAFGILAG